MSNSSAKSNRSTEENGPFQLSGSENSSRSPLSINFGDKERGCANDDDDPAIGSLEPPVRRYGCANYDTCLDLAAALNWASFTCGACRGTINEQLLWRARHITRKDSIAKAICELPPVESLDTVGSDIKKK